MPKKDRIEEDLRAVDGELGREAGLAPLRVSGHGLAPQLIAGEARQVNEVAGVLAWPAGGLRLLNDAPAAAEFHRPSRELGHLGHRHRAVSALHEQALDAACPELHGEREPYWSSAHDEHRDARFGVLSARQSASIPGNAALA